MQHTYLFKQLLKANFNRSTLLISLIFLGLTALQPSVTFAQAPTITSFAPLSAKYGDVVTITGTGFNTNLPDNIVFFGATRAIVTTADATSLIVEVPLGATYAPITVLNTGTQLAANSPKSFNPIYSPSKTSITTNGFLEKQDFATGPNPYSVAIGDLDGDSKPDLAIANTGSDKVSVLPNTSTYGTNNTNLFGGKVDRSTGSLPYSVAISDLDGDGYLDIIVANNVSSTVSVLRNLGAGFFQNSVDFTTGLDPISVAVGDIDGDGKPDLAVANYSSNSISILRNTSTSGSIDATSFATKVDLTAVSPYSVAIGDLDNDGKPDLAVANRSSMSVSVFHNTSTSGAIDINSFAAKVDFTTGSNPVSVVIGDLDVDGKLDLAVANTNSDNVSVLRNSSTSGIIDGNSFEPKVDFTTGTNPISVAIGDLDGNGKPDLVVANQGSNTVSVLRNTGTSGFFASNSFAAKVDFTTGTGPISVAIGDFDLDGKPDIAVANFSSNSVSIIRNADSPPVITSFSPLSAKPDDVVTLTGTDFNTTTTNNVVFFGATKATIISASKTSLTVTVPKGATYAPITILNTSTKLTAYSTQNFNPIYAPSKTSIATADFLPKHDFTTGAQTSSVATGDLDGDGKPDLVVVNTFVNSISIFRNTSTSGSIVAGSFAPKIDFATEDQPFSIAIGDLNNDGKLDLAVTNVMSNSVSIFQNTSTSGTIDVNSFSAKVDFTTGTQPQSLAIGDLDGDGKPDLVVGNSASANVSVFHNTITSGTIDVNSFASKSDFTTGNTPLSVAIGDLDGDGKADLAVTNFDSNNISILLNTSTNGILDANSFATKVDFLTNLPNSLAIGDLDGDGKADLAVTNFGSNSVSVFQNTSTSGIIDLNSFANGIDFTTGTSPISVSIGDLDGDGKPDLAVANNSSNSVSIFNNISTSGVIDINSFAAKVDFTTGTQPRSVAISDLDGDGKLDLALANQASNNVSIIRNADIPAPIITSFSPLSAKPGDVVTLTGTGFNTTTTNNIVFFGATRATVTVSTATSLTVTVPTGATYAPITLLNTGTQLAAYSLANFNPIYATAKTSITATDFLPKQDFTTGLGPISMAIGDLNGDGKADLAVTNFNSNTVSVYQNTSTSGSISSGSFATKIDFNTGSNPFSVAIGDLDGDSKPDLVVANRASASISIYRNTSTSGSLNTSSFAAKVDFTTGSLPRSVAMGDLDGDGKPDLAVANQASASISIFRNISTSGNLDANSFVNKVDFTTGTQPYSVTISDLNGDGKFDLTVANFGSANVSVLRNTSTSGAIIAGSFAAKIDFGTGTQPSSVSIGDIDGDGKPDLAVTNQGSNSVSVLRNTSTNGSIIAGSFAAKVDFTTGNEPRSVAIGDLDGDGKPDLAVANYTANKLSVYRNTAVSGNIVSASFASMIDFTTGSGAGYVTIGDLDGDNKPDLAVVNFSSNGVSVIRNTSNNPDLANLTLSSGTLSPVFAAGTISYTTSVSNGTTSITVTPTKADANSTITVNGVAVTSGSASGAIALSVGSNSITTVVTSQNGITKTYTVTITRVNNAPTDITLSANSINENVAANSQIGTFSSTDADAGNTFTYSFVAGGADNGSFSISGNSLTINSIPNFEVKSSYAITIRTTDQGNLFFDKAFTITINNINESPTVANAIPNQNATENQAFNYQFALNTFTDEDANANLTYTAQLNGGGVLPSWLSFNMATRTFSGTPLNANIGTISIDVIANDGSGGTVTAVFNIIVGSTLPVTLNQYSAKLQTDGTVLLTWDTFAEQNNNYFEISRSIDGRNFTVLGTVKGNGTSSVRNLYSYLDKSPSIGENYYKLVQVDLDGTRKELGIRSARVTLANETEVMIYPNPSTDLVSVSFEPGMFNNVYLFDLLGKILLSRTLSIKEDSFNFNLKDLPASIYILRLDGNDKVISKQIVKK